MKDVVGAVIPYLKKEKIQERKTKKAEIQRKVDLFRDNFDKLSLEDKEDVFKSIQKFFWLNGAVRLVDTDSQEYKEEEVQYQKFTNLLPEGLWPKYVYEQKSRIKQQKIKLQQQKELQSALLPDTESEGSEDDENEHKFGSGSEEIKK